MSMRFPGVLERVASRTAGACAADLRAMSSQVSNRMLGYVNVMNDSPYLHMNKETFTTFPTVILSNP